MRNVIYIILFLFLIVSLLHGLTSEDMKKPGFYSEYTTNEKGETFTYSYILTDEGRIPEKPLERISLNNYRYSDTTVLWVDRAHLNAIAENVTISGDGMTIFAGWWLNNERASFYRSLGVGTPLWYYSIPLADWMVDVASSDDSHLMAATSSGSPLTLWDKLSSIPILTYTYPSGFKSGQCAVSSDGSTAAAAADNAAIGRLFVFNEDGDSLYAVDFDRGSGIYGVELSSDGSIAVVSTYYVISIFENGILRGTISNYGQTAAHVSGDGSRVVKGDFNGRVTVYEWNGSNYIQMWQSYIGGPWVVAVDISEDGSTVMAGTGYSNGKSVMFDISSSTPLWTFQGYGSYGSYVKAVSLSDNGSIGVATSWGDTAQTGTFYVLTVHAKTDSAPIIGVTRNDEPGSLFDCDISSDGEHITAGGKAVHAYQWGNGGEVYSVLVGSTPSVNAATESIDNPTHLIQVGDVISPQATFTNCGDNPASFDIFFSIEDSTGSAVYSSSSTVSNLAPGATHQETFTPDWSPLSYNYYKAYVWCELSGDQYPGDDTLTLDIKCFHDAEARTIIVPFDETTINIEITPQAVIYNNGSYTETIEAILTISDSTGNPVYTDTTLSSSLSPETEGTVTFAPLTPGAIGNYSCELTVYVTDDINPVNDITTKNSYFSYEIIYDDGMIDGFYVVSYSYDNNKFAVRFTPTISTPLYLKGGRIFVNATDEFDYVQLCNDAVGLPDTITPLREVYNVGAPSASDWAHFSFDSFEVTTLRDFWIVIHWPPSSPGSPGVGADNCLPNSRSWWYNNSSGWNNWTSHNWMIRLVQSPGGSGISAGPSEIPSCYQLYRCYPNPFNKKTLILYDISEETKCNIDVFDISGRRIKALKDKIVKPGHYTVEWNGRNNHGKRVASGIYFYRLKTKNYSKMRKLLFIK